ncbi:cytochrome c maturation protein CcmE [Paralimibaculum aggregatum]|uniref:Cytochrome c-type biogenesis protein CcmE n=1 Tax=Paralimibaculum aggregatum TaxID=3036245 RepID=A0ABQ6LP31_9RHOB|nr:cytochrome c maturation protein CcmE [Limibaculum sp. NKW23]GMG84747.1 cytochrome c maturation protein CcmE [Limibaculum sp. NKW23]
MASRKKIQRIRMLAFGFVALVGAVVLVALTFDDTIAFFKSPSEIVAAPPPPEQLLRIGGLVAEGSLVRGEGETVSFDVTDGAATVRVSFTGVLPDLFREGQGVIAEGRMQGGTFAAQEVLAKHDENYIPREVADALKEQGHWQEDAGTGGGS